MKHHSKNTDWNSQYLVLPIVLEVPLFWIATLFNQKVLTSRNYPLAVIERGERWAATFWRAGRLPRRWFMRSVDSCLSSWPVLAWGDRYGRSAIAGYSYSWRSSSWAAHSIKYTRTAKKQGHGASGFSTGQQLCASVCNLYADVQMNR